VGFSSNIIITNNNCSNNSRHGISLDSASDNIIISYNNFYNNTHYGVYISHFFGVTRAGYIIHHNNFWQNNGAGKGVNGNCQAYDDVGGNYWYDNTAQEGNYWSNWNGQGWGTPNAYPIDGGAGAYDMYPLSTPVTPDLSPMAIIVSALGLLGIAALRRRK
jgi:parallel beta-helix repeat protein